MGSFVYSDPIKKQKIGFFLRTINLRGVETTTFDYAHFNEEILNNESYIFLVDKDNVDIKNPDSPLDVRKKIVDRFGDRFYECDTFDQVETLIDKLGVQILYNQKAGAIDNHVSKKCKNAVHCVFQNFQPHGDACATISEWLSKNEGLEDSIAYVPYICDLPNTKDDLRKELGIPKNSIVFGRHGGYNTFDIPFVMEAVVLKAISNPNFYFVFMNTQPFYHRDYGPLKNIIFLKSSIDPVFKTKFINTCDAMLHARQLGESFGLACAEFNIRNKPVITWSEGHDKAHLDMLGSSCFKYKSPQDLNNIFDYFEKNIDLVRSKSWDVYSNKYNPANVMKKFDKVFIQPLL